MEETLLSNLQIFSGTIYWICITTLSERKWRKNTKCNINISEFVQKCFDPWIEINVLNVLFEGNRKIEIIKGSWKIIRNL